MWIDIDQASAKLNVSRRTLQRRISENKIKSKIDGNRRIVWLEETDDTPTTKENESLKKQVGDLLNQVGQLSDKLAAEATKLSAELFGRRPSSLNGKTIVMVTHDPRAAAVADRTLHLEKAQLVTPEPAHR